MDRNTHKALGLTKALAKVANRIAKKFPNQTKGVYLINSIAKELRL